MYNTHTLDDLIIFYDEREWRAVWERIVEEYGVSMNIRGTCHRELGFTVRRHTVWRTDEGGYKYPEQQIHLDFDSSEFTTAFILKYF